jgi:hypothetical protein
MNLCKLSDNVDGDELIFEIEEKLQLLHKNLKDYHQTYQGL